MDFLLQLADRLVLLLSRHRRFSGEPPDFARAKGPLLMAPGARDGGEVRAVRVDGRWFATGLNWQPSSSESFEAVGSARRQFQAVPDFDTGGVLACTRQVVPPGRDEEAVGLDFDLSGPVQGGVTDGAGGHAPGMVSLAAWLADGLAKVEGGMRPSLAALSFELEGERLFCVLAQNQGLLMSGTDLVTGDERAARKVFDSVWREMSGRELSRWNLYAPRGWVVDGSRELDFGLFREQWQQHPPDGVSALFPVSLGSFFASARRFLLGGALVLGGLLAVLVFWSCVGGGEPVQPGEPLPKPKARSVLDRFVGAVSRELAPWEKGALQSRASRGGLGDPLPFPLPVRDVDGLLSSCMTSIRSVPDFLPSLARPFDGLSHIRCDGERLWATLQGGVAGELELVPGVDYRVPLSPVRSVPYAPGDLVPLGGGGGEPVPVPGQTVLSAAGRDFAFRTALYDAARGAGSAYGCVLDDRFAVRSGGGEVSPVELAVLYWLASFSCLPGVTGRYEGGETDEGVLARMSWDWGAFSVRSVWPLDGEDLRFLRNSWRAEPALRVHDVSYHLHDGRGWELRGWLAGATAAFYKSKTEASGPEPGLDPQAGVAEVDSGL